MTKTIEELWTAVLAQIQLIISPANFTAWFRDTKIISRNEKEITVLVPNIFVEEWLEQKHKKNILKILQDLNEDIREIKYVISKQEPIMVLKKHKQQVEIINQPSFPEFKIDKDTGLNSKYLFENFVVGPFNELPHAAALAVSKNPGTVYNPFFVYGNVGLGKTHLIQAVGNEIDKNFPEKKIKYIPSEKFTSEVITAIRNQEIETLKAKYYPIDVFILDDVQFLAGKEKTQEILFHIFNALYEKNKQIIFSSDRPPKTIPSLTERLRSRFEGGMIADVSNPDFETLVAILKTKLKEKEVSFPEDLLYYIASNIQKNIRELEGALNRLIGHQKLNKEIIDLEKGKKILKNLILPPIKTTSPKKIIQIIAQFYDLKEKDLLMTSRKKEIVLPRQIAMYLLRKELKFSYPSIGRKFQGKDHTTAIYAYEKINKEIEKNEKLKEEIDLIKQQIFNF